MCTKKANRNSILTDEKQRRNQHANRANQLESTVKCTTKLNLNRRRDLPLGNPVVDAADLRPDACLAKYSGVAAAHHFALGFFLLVQITPAAPHL